MSKVKYQWPDISTLQSIYYRGSLANTVSIINNHYYLPFKTANCIKHQENVQKYKIR